MTTSSDFRCRANQVLKKALEGHASELEELLSMYRGYLLALAVARMDPRLRPRCDASDIVQDTMLEAFRDFRQFRGQQESEFLGWIRQILAHNLACAVKQHVLVEKRDIRKEVETPMQLAANESRLEMHENWFVDSAASPSSIVQKQEQLQSVLDRISKLPSHYRDVLLLRHIEELSFEEVAQRLGKTSGAVRMIWLRALESLREVS
ncbi:MAG: sigma-70 family RNA polymerase sigma factor [Planctomycetaceae bacterium]|nr:sigma-70 family RNA polymerase sigma factor [Planctomycetaceae bacterium]MBN8604843.1 sigma-70 family RNA polymerase sigma factor [Planctomycetota bacterium]